MKSREPYPNCAVHLAFEACGFGYEQAWWARENGIAVTVIAPSRMERAPGLQVKTDRLDVGRMVHGAVRLLSNSSLRNQRRSNRPSTVINFRLLFDAPIDVAFIAYDLYNQTQAIRAGDSGGIATESAALAADVAGVFLPGTGFGLGVRSMRGADRAHGAARAGIQAVNAVKGVGEASKATSKIDRGAFAKERAAHWKQEATANPSKCGKDDLARMEKGKAPIGSDGHPMELHHKERTMQGGLEPMTRTEHRLGDNYKKNHPD